MGIFDKFKLGFKKSASNIASGLREIIVKKEIDDETLNKIEEFLISSDVGIDAASEIKSIIAEKKIESLGFGLAIVEFPMFACFPIACGFCSPVFPHVFRLNFLILNC